MNKFSLATLIIGLLLSCNFHKWEINTSNPQASVNIESSKKDSLFVKEYKILPPSTPVFKANEAWIEYCWRNKLDGSKIAKMKTAGMQLNFTIKTFDTNFNDKDYLINWQMKDETNGYVGQASNAHDVYTLFLEEPKLQDSFRITISKIKNDRSATNAGEFIIARQQP